MSNKKNIQYYLCVQHLIREKKKYPLILTFYYDIFCHLYLDIYYDEKLLRKLLEQISTKSSLIFFLKVNYSLQKHTLILKRTFSQSRCCQSGDDNTDGNHCLSAETQTLG